MQMNCCRMENSVLGNALEGVPEEEEDGEEEKPKESNVDSTENIDGGESLCILSIWVCFCTVMRTLILIT